MMVEDREDYEEVVTIKGSDNTGALQTVALDSEHRMIARTIDSIDDAVTIRVATQATSTSHDAILGTVPAGKIWKINAVTAKNYTHLTKYMHVHKIDTNNIGYPIKTFYDIPAGLRVAWGGEMWLTEGEKLSVEFELIAVGDILHVYGFGIQLNRI